MSYNLEQNACKGLYAVRNVSRLLYDALVDKQEVEVDIRVGIETFPHADGIHLDKRLDGSCEIRISIKKKPAGPECASEESGRAVLKGKPVVG